MILTGLSSLYKDMKTHSLDRFRFEYKHGKGSFDVFFFIDESPFILLFGAQGTQFSFELTVQNGFTISAKLDHDTYLFLCKFLCLEFDPNNPFSPAAFFVQFNQRIPSEIGGGREPQPNEVALYRQVEEQDKIYFAGWRNNRIRKEFVSQFNLDKTRRLLGYKVYLLCRDKNISSCWTDKVNESARFHLPD